MIERFAKMPSALRANARWARLGASHVPALLVHPDWDRPEPAPLVIWMHGRTAHKELDPGRYLRWMRSGIGACAVDLPGHGERSEPALDAAARNLEVIQQMIDEIDELVAALADLRVFDLNRMGIGGMSAGGMATLARLCRPHPFRCASIEAAAGSWNGQSQRALFTAADPDVVAQLNPIAHLDSWREIPLQAIHSKLDEWVPFQRQAAFIEALRRRYRNPTLIDFVQYERTGASNEHMGFGKLSSDAKNRQREFFRRWLVVGHHGESAA